VGLPGQVWESGHALWVHNVPIGPAYPRAAVAIAEGMRSAVAFPIRLSGEIAAVMEFFSRQERLREQTQSR
jgi:hypothetical protein